MQTPCPCHRLITTAFCGIFCLALEFACARELDFLELKLLPVELRLKGLRFFLPLSNGNLIAAENGLFRLNHDGSVNALGIEHSVNEIAAVPDGLLLATDGGAFSFDPAAAAIKFSRIGTYHRSVRGFLMRSDRDVFIGTQDGLIFSSGDTFRKLGKNTEVDKFVGLLGESAVAICGREIGFATDEAEYFVDCSDTISSAVLVGDEVLVGTMSGLFGIREGTAQPVIERLKIYEIVAFNGAVYLISPDGVFRGEADNAGGHDFSKISDAFFTDISAHESGLYFVGEEKVARLANETSLMDVCMAKDAEKCHRIRRIDETLFLCLDSGLVRIDPESGLGTFTGTDHEVKDVLKMGATLIAAAENDLWELASVVEEPRRNTSAAVLFGIGGAIALMAGSAAWFLRRRSALPVVFVSYRRGEAPERVARLRDQLAADYGKDRVRMDVHTFGTGEDFREEISRNINEASVVLVVIGPDWLRMTDATGVVRLYAAIDYVRFEIELALAAKKRIIPVLLDDTRMPAARSLPDSIASLSYRGASRLRGDPDFQSDLRCLVEEINASNTRSAPSEGRR